MLDPITHTITYALFQTMFSLFLASPFAGKTAEGDFFTIKPQEMVRLLSQPKVAGVRYYFTLDRNRALSAVVMAVDSNGKEKRDFILNGTEESAEKGIVLYQAAGMVKRTGTKYCTLGVATDKNGKVTFDSGKSELLKLAQTAPQIRAFYCMNPNNNSLVLVFASADPTGLVIMSDATKDDITLLDNGAQCPPFCNGGK